MWYRGKHTLLLFHQTAMIILCILPCVIKYFSVFLSFCIDEIQVEFNQYFLLQQRTFLESLLFSCVSIIAIQENLFFFGKHFVSHFKGKQENDQHLSRFDFMGVVLSSDYNFILSLLISSYEICISLFLSTNSQGLATYQFRVIQLALLPSVKGFTIRDVNSVKFRKFCSLGRFCLFSISCQI